MKPRPSRSNQAPNKVDIQMTPMLDMIFQLLIFFILTFRPVADEGQFEVLMSSVAAGSTAEPNLQLLDPIETELPITITLRADPNGGLLSGGLLLGERRLASVEMLTSAVGELVGQTPEDFEVLIRADSQLHYEHVMQTINAISHAGVKTVNFASLP